MNILLNQLCVFLELGFSELFHLSSNHLWKMGLLSAAKVGQSKTVLDAQSPTASLR